MTDSFGARLRQRRESEHITLASIAEQTKINPSLLEALERGDVSHWPAGIFRRAFIRAYAHAVNLDPDVVVREFLERYPDPIEAIATEPVPAHVGRAGANDGPPIRLRYLVGSAAESVSRWLASAGTRPATAQPAMVEPAVVEIRQAVAENVPSDDRDQMPLAAATTATPYEPDLLAAAHLCTELGRVYETHEAEQLLQRAAGILDAVGVIVWAWDAQSAELRPALAHGYSDKVLAQLPKVRREADNATAAAFRSTQTCIVNGTELASGAVTVPLMTSGGCVGVFAAELRHGGEQREPLRALATIFAAQLATLIGTPRWPQAVNA
jgi:transcriptional regulator with XRE-family HTH domain